MEIGRTQQESLGCQYFQKNTKLLIEKTIEEGRLIFKNAGDRFNEEYDSYGNIFKKNVNQEYDKKINELERLNKMFNYLKDKVTHKQHVQDNLAERFYLKNLLKRVYVAWKYFHQYNVYLYFKQQDIEKYYTRHLMLKMMNRWKQYTKDEVKLEIKYKSVRITENEISSLQKQYQKIIKDLEQNLSQKIMELKQEEETHKLLYSKYDNLVDERQKENKRNLEEVQQQ